MKIFIDTNIFLDLILQREYYKESLIIFNAIEKNIFEGVILDITLLNIDYIARKQVKDVREFLTTVNSLFTIAGADNNMIKQALKIKNTDLEDNLQYVCAEKLNCTCIVSNDQNFYSAVIPVLSSKAFIYKYIN
jgi:predicted nucleic acid-binding protein